MKHIAFPSIEQFRNVVKEVQLRSEFVGKDNDDEPIYDESRPKPVLTFSGTVKLHGTNAGVSFNDDTGEMWFQSRENIITPEKDNAGFANWANSKREVFKKFFNRFSFFVAFRDGNHDDKPGDKIFTIFGEWAGGGFRRQ